MFVKRYGKIVALIVVTLGGLGVLATGDASEREVARAGDLRGVSEGMLEFREA